MFRFDIKTCQSFEESDFDVLTESQKLQKDVCFVANIIHAAYNEITDKETYDCLAEIMQDIDRLEKDEEELLTEEEENRNRVSRLKKLLVREKKSLLKDIENATCDLFKEKEHFEDSLSKYVKEC